MPPNPNAAPVFSKNDPQRKPDISEFPDAEAILGINWNQALGKWVPLYKSDDEVSLVAQNDMEYGEGNEEVCLYDPLTDKSVKPKFSKFPEPEDIMDIEWNEALGKWVPIYKSDRPIY